MRFVRYVIGGSLILLLFEIPQLFTETTAVTSFLTRLAFNNNFSIVSPGKFYRSAEMSNEDLTKTIKEYGLRTIIDLRTTDKKEVGEGGLQEWQVVENAGATYIHMPMVGSRMLSPEEVEELLGVYDHNPTPILVHCSSGTHRSGVAAAIWLLAKETETFEKAREQLSPRFGFFRFERDLKSYLQGHPTIDKLLWRYQDAAEEQGINFRSWVEKEFKGEKASAQ